jgi:XamI restriction endonuclease
MTAPAPVWSTDRLAADLLTGREMFRRERLDEPREKYLEFYEQDRRAVHELLEQTRDLRDLREMASELLSQPDGVNVARYLASPPISTDDLTVLVDTSIAPSMLRRRPADARRVIDTILLVLDRERFPWFGEDRRPTAAERHGAVVATAAMRAFRRVETFRRNEGKRSQEEAVKEFLVRECGFTRAPTLPIENISQAPPPGQYCDETLVGSRRADIPVRLWDGRLMPIECKVSNSGTNSYKRINNDAAIKASKWRDELGRVNCVPTAVLTGVFVLANLEYAQQQHLTLFWEHSLGELKDFIDSTR